VENSRKWLQISVEKECCLPSSVKFLIATLRVLIALSSLAHSVNTIELKAHIDGQERSP
jgi:hypothetical protein